MRNFQRPSCVKVAVITLEEEHALIDRILAGDHDRYSVLVDQYQRYAFSIALKVIRSRADAEEVAQDSFVKAFRYLKDFNRKSRFSTWLYRIVFNTALSYRRKTVLQVQEIESVDKESAVRPDDGMERADKQVYVQQALDRLNAADRLSVQLYYLQEFSLEEVAATMGQQVNTIKVRIHRARLRLAEELKKILKEEAITL